MHTPAIGRTVSAAARKALNRLAGRRVPAQPNAPATCWDTYKEYLEIHPTAIVDPVASIKIWNPPFPVKNASR